MLKVKENYSLQWEYLGWWLLYEISPVLLLPLLSHELLIWARGQNNGRTPMKDTILSLANIKHV